MSKQDYTDELERCQEELETAIGALPEDHLVDADNTLAESIDWLVIERDHAHRKLNKIRAILSGETQ